MKLLSLLDTRFALFLQVLSTDYHERADAFKALACPRKTKSPLQLFWLLLAYTV